MKKTNKKVIKKTLPLPDKLAFDCVFTILRSMRLTHTHDMLKKVVKKYFVYEY